MARGRPKAIHIQPRVSWPWVSSRKYLHPEGPGQGGLRGDGEEMEKSEHWNRATVPRPMPYLGLVIAHTCLTPGSGQDILLVITKLSGKPARKGDDGGSGSD